MTNAKLRHSRRGLRHDEARQPQVSNDLPSSGLLPWMQPPVSSQPRALPNVADVSVLKALPAIANDEPVVANSTFALPRLNDFLRPSAVLWCACQGQHCFAVHASADSCPSRRCCGCEQARPREDSQGQGQDANGSGCDGYSAAHCYGEQYK